MPWAEAVAEASAEASVPEKITHPTEPDLKSEDEDVEKSIQQKKSVVEEEEEEDEETCAFCKFMKGGGCKAVFVVSVKCP